MPHSMTRWRVWCGQTMLGWWCLGTLVVACLLALVVVLSWSAGTKSNDLRAIVGTPLLLVALAYGGFRAVYFHPLANRPYGDWLRNQPWTPGQALPLGPWHFVWQDAIYVGGLAATMIGLQALGGSVAPGPYRVSIGGDVSSPSFRWEIMVGLLLSAFVIAYSAILLLKAVFVREAFGAYALGALVGCLSFCWITNYLIVAWFVALALASHLSSRRMLLRLAHYDTHGREIRGSLHNYFRTRVWPYTDLLGVTPNPLVPPIHTLLIATVSAWVVGSWANFYPLFLSRLGLKLSPHEFAHIHRSTLVAIIMFGIILSVVRLIFYWLAGSAPFGVLARFRLMRPILPGFDVAFLAPLVTMAIAVAVPRLLFALHVPVPAVAGISVFLMVLTIFGLGPTLDTWRHVGHHRMRARFQDRRMEVSTQ